MSDGPSLAAIALAILATSVDPAWRHWALVQDAPQNARPHQERYRAGVELVTVDVTVVDADGTPVTALAPDNFEVRVDDTVRHPVSVQFVDARGDDRRAPDIPPAGDWPRGGRRFVFVVDRESMPFGHGPQVLGAAGQFIDAFAPGDRAAVWIVSNASGRLTFTHDRAVLKKSLADAYGIAQSPPDDVRLAPGEALLIDKGDPDTTRQVVGRECDRLLMSGRPECGQLVRSTASRVARDGRIHAEQMMTALRNLARSLRSLEGPTHVLLVTDGIMQHPEVMMLVREAAAAAADARVHLHTLQPWSGAWLDQAEHRRPDASASGMRTASLSGALSPATITGGHAATYVSPQVAFARLTRELSASYLLAFEPLPGDRDGHAHRIEVRVKGTGRVTVRARQQFTIDASAAAPPQTASQPDGAARQTRPLPRGSGGDPAAPVAPSETPRDEAPSPAVAASTMAATPGDLAGIVSKMRIYVAQFERELASVVVEERYVQIAKPWTGPPRGPEREPALEWLEAEARRSRTIVFASRRLRGDMLLVQASDGRWVGFRDVFEVDGKPVRDRDDRVKRLFLSGSANRGAELARISRESARYNLGTLTRTLNFPTFPLLYLHQRHADHLRYSRKGAEAVDGHACVVLEFTEIGRPTIVGTPGGRHVPAWGRVWVEADTGRVRRIEARVEINDARRQAVRVTFGDDERIGALVPREMWEWYEGATILGQGKDLMIEALATYSNLRRFTVETSEQIEHR